MYVLAINGSPRKGGNTEILLNQVLAPLNESGWDTELVQIGGKAMRGGGIHVYDTINHMFLMSQMIVPGATYWNLGFGLAKGDVEQDDEGAANMLCLGQTIDWLGRAMKPHQESFPKAYGNHG